MRTVLIGEAVRDFRYLLDRGYSQKSSLNLVVDKYQLRRREKWVLLRGVYPKEVSERRKNKIVGLSKAKRLGVDGYNVLITVEAAIGGDTLIKSDDGIVRDVRGVFGKYRINKMTEKVLIMILKKLRGKTFSIYYDSQVSKSGELAKLTRRLMNEIGVKGEVCLSKKVDFELKKFNTVATSDGPVIDSVKNVVDIPGYFAKKESLLSLE